MLIRHLDSHIQFMVTSYLITMLLCMFSLCYLVTKSERSSLRATFTITQIVTILWLLFALRERLSLTFAEILFNIRVSLISINFAAPLWLITILFFTGRLARKKFWLILVILAIPFVLSAPMLLPESSDIFKLYIKEMFMDERARVLFETWGPFETATTLYATFCILLSFFSLTIHFRKNNSVKMLEKIVALLILCSPIAVHYVGLFFDAPFDLTPLTFSLWGVITIYLSFQRQFFNAVPSLVWNIFHITKESMVVLSADGSVNVNKTFSDIFGPRGNDFLSFAEELSVGLSEHIRKKHDVNCIEAVRDGVYYEISLKNVLGRRNKVLGQLVTISDISETKQLTLAKERARIASGLHDSMGNRLIASINNMNLALQQQTLDTARPFMDAAATSSTASLMTLRKIVEGLLPVDFGEAKLIPLVESVINRISASGVLADLQIFGEPEKLPVSLKEFIYNTCQEALTNSVIHGKAENIVIKLECIADMFRLNILDDGRGCETVFKNNGLTTMENRAKTLGGGIEFASPSPGGFGIYAEIPVKVGEQE